MKNKEEQTVPKLRFKGYTDAWQQGKLGDKVNFYSGLTYKPENIQTNGVLVLRSSNIQNHHINLNDNIYVSPEVVNTTFVKKGDLVVVVRNGSKNLIGKHAPIKEKMNNTVIGAFMTGIRSKDNFYIKALLDSDIFKKEIQKNLGATINQIITGNFKKMVFPFSSQEEEKSIGNLFTKLDETITLLQRKIELYEFIKKVSLQSLLPSYNQINPIVRWKHMNDSWQRIKFSQLYKKSNEKNNLSFNFQKVISVATMSWKDVPKNSSAEYMKTYNVIRKGDIVFEGNKSKDYEFGRFVENTLGDGIVSHVFDVYRPKNPKKNNLSFWKYYIHSEASMRNILRKSTTSATMMKNLVKNDLYKQYLSVPSSLEQEKIGQLFSKLDSTIGNFQDQLSTLNNLKKFLLQNMFI